MGTVSEPTKAESTFHGHFPEVAEQGPDWVRELRRRAFAKFEEKGFPTSRDEEWRKTSLKTLQEIAFASPASVTLTPETVTTALKAAAVPEVVHPIRIVVVNGVVTPELSDLTELPEGVEVRSLSEKLTGDGADLQGKLGSGVNWDEHPFAALNTALHRDGVWLRVAAQTKVERPLLILHLAGGSTEPVAVHPRHLIDVGEASDCVVIESFHAISDEDVYLTNAVTEVEVDAHAHVAHYKIELEAPGAFHFQSLHANQREESRFMTHAFTFGGRLGRNDIRATLGGEEIETVLNGIYMLTGEQLFDTHTHLDHAMPNCRSHEWYKGILNGKAHGVFTGKILVRQDAQKTDAIQSSKGLLLSEEATLNAQPQLEIYADDVKCTHGATIGRLDEDALFYLETRGLNRKSAHALLTFAFANDILREVPNGAVRDHLETLIHDWLDRHGLPEADI